MDMPLVLKIMTDIMDTRSSRIFM